MKFVCRSLIAVTLSGVLALASAADGLITVQSPHGVKATMDKLEAAVKDQGLTVFARIDHAAGAAKIGKMLRATEVLIFGNPQGGTPLMACAQSAGIDLPLKALVWEDEAAKVWVGYNEPAWLAQRHGAADCAVVPNLQKALQGLTAAAVAP